MIKPNPILYVLLFGIFFWFCIFYFGFFKTVMTTIILSAIAGIVLNLYENRY